MVVAAVCCATPVLVLALGALGASAWLAWRDYVVIAALVAFALLAACGFHRRRSNAPGECFPTSNASPGAPPSIGKSP